jgi:hypothetical protein
MLLAVEHLQVAVVAVAQHLRNTLYHQVNSMQLQLVEQELLLHLQV